MIGLICFVIGALILFADALDLLKGSIDWVELAAGFVVLGVALAGVALPKFALSRQE